MITPTFLKPSCKVGIISTARAISTKEITPAIQWLENNDFQVVIGDTIDKKYHQFAGDDTLRTNDLQAMLNNPNIDAIWCARGGYGTARLLDKLDFSAFLSYPKWILGYSDVTALHWHLQHLGIASAHCSMPINLKTNTLDAISSIKKFLLGEKIEYEWQNTLSYPAQQIKGECIGGNLSVIYSLLGSISKIETKGKILLLEDVDEYLYHTDRMLLNLVRNGIFNDLQAVVVGVFSQMHDNTIPFGKNAYEIIAEHCAPFGFPIIFNAPFGHIEDNRLFPLGKTIDIQLDSQNVKISF
ncbi:MAG: LD-carboxypeptidase [Capnocytophaga sp.]|nr:LD-carboxypeptidase [Capnocytophaga sp.]